MRFDRAAVLALSAFALTGCVLPAAAPTIREIQHDAEHSDSYFMVNVDAGLAQDLAVLEANGHPEAIKEFTYTPSIAIRAGDTVTINVFTNNASSSSSSGPQPASSLLAGAPTALPVETVDQAGEIVVPYVGRMTAAGKTPTELSDEITRRLAKVVYQPQVVVTTNNGTNVASVNGDVNHSGAFALTLRGERLLDAVAWAGGPKFPTNEMEVRLVRGSRIVSIAMDEIFENPSENILVKPDDQIVVLHRPKTYTVLGATLKPAQYNFDTPDVTLAEAVSRSGGAADNIGNLAGVYVLRTVPTAAARAMLGPYAKAASAKKPAAGKTAVEALETAGPSVQVLFHVDMSSPAGVFFAKKIMISDKDVVLFANASGSQQLKALAITRGYTGIVFDLTARTAALTN